MGRYILSNDFYIPDDLQNEKDAQINAEKYELWCLQVELNRINTFMETLELGKSK
jgi:hypothetical protein